MFAGGGDGLAVPVSQRLAAMTRLTRHVIGEFCHITSARAVLSRFGRVWCTTADVTPEASDTEKAKGPDVFVSHSWEDDRCRKHLAMCFFLNYNLSLKAFAAAVVLSQTALLFLGPLSLSLNVLFLIVLDAPTLVFLITFFAGQQLTCGWWSPSMWLDRLCIDQVDLDQKTRGILELPAVVANSEQLLVLLGETYFERLWCSFELSIFVKLRGLQKLCLVPLWMAPWLLACFLASYATNRLTAVYLVLMNEPQLGMVALSYDGAAAASPLSYGQSRMLLYLASAPSIALFTAMPFILTSVQTFPKKLMDHEAMLRALECYNIRLAKCSLEQDRTRIEEHVAELFDGLEEPVLAVAIDSAEGPTDAEGTDLGDMVFLPASVRCALRRVTSYLDHDECLDKFNHYVQQRLRDMLVEDLGIETQLLWSHCLLFAMPVVLAGSAQTWVTWPLHQKMGYPSVEQYSAATVMAFLATPLSYACMPPCILRFTACTVAKTGPGLLRNVLLLVGGYLAACISAVFYTLVVGAADSFVITCQPVFCAILVLVLMLQLLLNCHLFGVASPTLPQQLLSCRCLCRSHAYDAVK